MWGWWRRSLICGVCQFLWCKPHPPWLISCHQHMTEHGVGKEVDNGPRELCQLTPAHHPLQLTVLSPRWWFVTVDILAYSPSVVPFDCKLKFRVRNTFSNLVWCSRCCLTSPIPHRTCSFSSHTPCCSNFTSSPDLPKSSLDPVALPLFLCFLSASYVCLHLSLLWWIVNPVISCYCLSPHWSISWVQSPGLSYSSLCPQHLEQSLANMFREQMLEFREAWLESSKVSFTWYLTSVSERLFFLLTTQNIFC